MTSVAELKNHREICAKTSRASHEIAINGERRIFVFVKRDQFGSKFRFDAKFAMNNGEKSTFQSINFSFKV